MLSAASISSYAYAINLCETSIVLINDLPLLTNRHTTTTIAKQKHARTHTNFNVQRNIHTQ